MTRKTRKRVRITWDRAIIATSAAVGTIAVMMPEFRDELGLYGGFVLVGVKFVDAFLRSLVEAAE